VVSGVTQVVGNSRAFHTNILHEQSNERNMGISNSLTIETTSVSRPFIVPGPLVTSVIRALVAIIGSRSSTTVIVPAIISAIIISPVIVTPVITTVVVSAVIITWGSTVRVARVVRPGHVGAVSAATATVASTAIASAFLHLDAMVSAWSGSTSATSTGVSHSQSLPFERRAVELTDGRLGVFGGVHLDEPKASRLLWSVGIKHDLRLVDLADFAKDILQHADIDSTSQSTDVKVVTLVGNLAFRPPAPAAVTIPDGTPTSLPLPPWAPIAIVGGCRILPYCEVGVSRVQSSRLVVSAKADEG